MKCSTDCRCKKHDRYKHPRVVIPLRDLTTYAQRQERAAQWQDCPSASFDWNRAIEGFKRILREVYGT